MSSTPLSRPPARGFWHPEEYQSLVHERAWLAIKDAPAWGSFVWNMFDFAVGGRKEGDRAGINDKGLVTYDRQTRKDAFCFYKSRWTTAPMVYLTGRRFTPRPSGATLVKVYANCPDVELFVNGKSAGKQSEKEEIFRWTVMLPAGTVKLEAVATAADGSKVRDLCSWSCAASNAPVLFSAMPTKYTRAPQAEVDRYMNSKKARATK